MWCPADQGVPNDLNKIRFAEYQYDKVSRRIVPPEEDNTLST